MALNGTLKIDRKLTMGNQEWNKVQMSEGTNPAEMFWGLGKHWVFQR